MLSICRHNIVHGSLLYLLLFIHYEIDVFKFVEVWSNERQRM